MTPKGRPLLLTARGVLPRAGQWSGATFRSARVLVDAGLLVSKGRVEELVVGARANKRLAERRGARVRDFGEACLVPGLVNAHAHLELTGFQDRVPGDSGFGAWVGSLLRAKAARGPERMVADARVGLERVLESGSTTVGDIASIPASLAALQQLGRGPRPRVRLFREVLDAWDPERTSSALEVLREPLRESTRLFEGYSPHAPFTVSAALLDGLARLARRRPRALSMHWAETPAEVEWMAEGSGELAAVLGASPRRSGLDLLEQAGLLTTATSLVHGNLPTRGEPERIAAAGASVVHCPGTHAFFGRAPFPLDRYERAGVNLALGTDSLASNDTLDLRVEAARLLAREPQLSGSRVLHMATDAGARALGLEGRVGRLEPGCFADALVVSETGTEHFQNADSVASVLLGVGAAPRGSEVDPVGVLLGGRSTARTKVQIRTIG